MRALLSGGEVRRIIRQENFVYKCAGTSYNQPFRIE
jgi:hypothetical protein